MKKRSNLLAGMSSDDWREANEVSKQTRGISELTFGDVFENEECSISEALEQSLKEVQLMREGKMDKRNVRDFMDQMRKEDEDDYA